MSIRDETIGSPTLSDADAAARIAEGLALHRAGDLAAATRAYDAVLAACPEHADALHLRGLAALTEGETDRAVSLLGRAVARSPSPRHLANLAMALGAAGRHEPAMDACLRALAARADYPEAWNTLGVALAALGRPDPALAAYDRALALRPDYVEAHLNRAGLLADLWRHAEATRGFAAAFALRPALAPTAGRRRVAFIATDRTQPGSLYRCDRMAEAARAAGWDAVVLALDAASDPDMTGLVAAIFWRVELSARVCRLIAYARAAGARIGLDLDDLVVDPDFATIAVMDGIRTIGTTEARTAEHCGRIRQMNEAADFGLATTSELAQHMRRAQHPVWVIPNGFDAATCRSSRAAVRARRRDPADGLLRIGYAGGTRTHQRDVAVAATALAEVLAARAEARLVLFREARGGCLVALDEMPALAARASQIEWREMVPLTDLPGELARFDINIVPLEPDNPFVACKSDLKYFEAALVSVPTVASPVGPFARAIAHGRNGLLASGSTEWRQALFRLLDDGAERARLGRAAYHDALRRYGPQAGARRLGAALDQLTPGAPAARAFAADLTAEFGTPPAIRAPDVPPSRTLFQHDDGRDSLVTVTVASYNYADYLIEALDSVADQTLPALDLVVVDDGSTDASVGRALDWAAAHTGRFARLAVLATESNVGLGGNRNVGVDWAETPWFLALDADNRLSPDCAVRLLATAERAGAAFAYPTIRQFGAIERLVPAAPFEPERLRAGNYIDAMALVAKWAWAAAGGYYVDRDAMGWEDYDLWCTLVEVGLHGEPVADAVADYRIHGASMSETLVETQEHKQSVVALIERRHPWVRVLSRAPDRRAPNPPARPIPPP